MCRSGCGASVQLGVAQGQVQGAIAAHREAADEPAGAVGPGGEVVLDELDQFAAEEGGVGGAVSVVGVEVSAAIGHHHDQRQIADVHFDP